MGVFTVGDECGRVVSTSRRRTPRGCSLAKGSSKYRGRGGRDALWSEKGDKEWTTGEGGYTASRRRPHAKFAPHAGG